MTRIDEPRRIDGRSARAERTRRAIVDAHLALLREGDLKPTGERIADRAGVSLRALWTNFKDLEALFTATSERLLEQVDTDFRAVDAKQPLPKRIDEFCRQRSRMLELIGPSARAARLREPFSVSLRRSRSRHIGRVRTELEELFEKELAALGAARDRVLQALTVATTFASWSMLRDELGQSPDEAQAVMAHTVGALLQEPHQL